MAKKEVLRIKLITPPGQFSFPYFTKKDEGRTYSDGKFKGDLLIDKETWVKTKDEIVNAVLAVGRDYFGSQSLSLKDFKHPFKDTDKIEKITDEKQKNKILIRAKSEYQPAIVGPTKGPDGKFLELPVADAAKIKGGDWGRFVVTVFPYSQQGGGVTFGLNVVQFWKSGEAFGGGQAAMINMLDEMEVPLEAPAIAQEGAGLGGF